MCGFLFEYDVQPSVKLYFSKSYMSIRIKRTAFRLSFFYFAFYFRLSEAKFPLTQKARENRKLLALQHLLQYFLMQNTEKADHSRIGRDDRQPLPFAHRTA